MQQNVFNLPAGAPFAKTLAQELLREVAGNPETLTRYRIFLPTRRACRVLRDTFLSLNAGKPLLLPRMMPLGDVEEEELSLLIFGSEAGFLDIPPAISPLKRQILLARMIAGNPGFAQGMDQALSLAQGLGRFMDQVIIEGLDFSDLEKIVPDDFAEHWKITIDFLKIITENWPKILAEEGMIDAAQRRNLLLEALAGYWKSNPPAGPVIAAGSTGSIPATAKLLRVIAGLPQGRVMLPGLDQGMDEESWDHIGESHPQFGLKQLLERMEIGRSGIQTLGQAGERAELAGEMMRPAQTVQQWKSFPNRANISAMLLGLEYYSCQSQQEEAQVIALIMRESLEQPERTVALITPDRTLARRVSTLCRRWGIEADDSAGQSLKEHIIGRFSLLCAQVLQGGFDPVIFLALLKHELCGFGHEYAGEIAQIEKEFLRQDYILPDFKTLQQKIVDKYGAQHHLSVFIQNFIAAIKPAKGLSFTDLLAHHLEVMEALAAQGKEDTSLWSGDAGEAAASFFTDLQLHAQHFPPVRMKGYFDILNLLMGTVTIRSPYGVHPRVLILGQLEARLTSADVMILGGLNEGIWPADAGHDPWMSRPMRRTFGLPAAERATGLAAHDFVQGFCGPRVVMTRASRLEGTPSVPARWLQRLETVLKASGRDLNTLSVKPYLAWARMMDHQEDFKPCERPGPKPPLSARPTGISITRVDQWMKDPYSIYAYDVLKLRKLKPLVQESDVALRGTLLHEILERFTRSYPEVLPEDAENTLIGMGQEIMEARLQDAAALRYWWPRFLRIAQWYVQHERQWREKAKYMESELEGNADIDVDGQPFNLQGKPDRIDRIQGGYGIIDYKSGSDFKASRLKAGALPQLPLAAMLLVRGGFEGKGLRSKEPDAAKKRVPKAPVSYLGYWKMTGGKNPGAEEALEEDIDQTVEIVEEGLKALVRAFREQETAYFSVPDTGNPPRFNDYEHLVRLKEWAALDETSDEEAA